MNKKRRLLLRCVSNVNGHLHQWDQICHTLTNTLFLPLSLSLSHTHFHAQSLSQNIGTNKHTITQRQTEREIEPFLVHPYLIRKLCCFSLLVNFSDFSLLHFLNIEPIRTFVAFDVRIHLANTWFKKIRNKFEILKRKPYSAFLLTDIALTTL